MSNSSSFRAHRVVVTTAGCVSPLGLELRETLSSLRAGKDCVSPVTAFDVSACQCRTAGQILDAALDDAALRRTLRASGWCRASRMLLLAVEEARQGDPDFEPEHAFIGSTSGGMTEGERFFLKVQGGSRRRADARRLREYVMHQPVANALEYAEWDIATTVLSNACASGTSAIGHAFLAVRNGEMQRVLCGGYDALCRLVYAGFDSLKASTADRCRPFDIGRSGLVLGEGAAILGLEEMESARRRSAPILGEVLGFGTACDNYHLTQPDPSGAGPREAMLRALRSAGLEAGEIDYINAHGTATPFNDASEGRAIGEVFAQVPVSSTKGQMGHSLGAAGAIEAVFCLLALQNQFLPANLNFTRCDEGLQLNVVANTSREARLQRVLSNSFGFGGANASIILGGVR